MRRRTPIMAAASAVLLASYLPVQARADTVPDCPTPPGATAASLDQGAPAPLLRAVRKQFGTFAKPGEGFNPTDVVQPGLSSRRLIFVWTRDRRWVVAMEQGGRSYSTPVAAFDMGGNGRTAALATISKAYPDTLCATATTLINGGPR